MAEELIYALHPHFASVYACGLIAIGKYDSYLMCANDKNHRGRKFYCLYSMYVVTFRYLLFQTS